MIEQLACKQGRRDEACNIELAEKLCSNTDKEGIFEIVNGYKAQDAAVASDCIKVLYEVARRKPELVVVYTADFINGLSSKNNRLVWGSMTALAHSAFMAAPTIYQRLDEVIAAYRQGSVITIDNSISVFAALCQADPSYTQKILPVLLNHFEHCRAKEIPQHAERLANSLTTTAKKEILKIIESRYSELSVSQSNRLKKILKTF